MWQSVSLLINTFLGDSEKHEIFYYFLKQAQSRQGMGNGFMSRPSSADSDWGQVEETRDEEEFQPIR